MEPPRPSAPWSLWQSTHVGAQKGVAATTRCGWQAIHVVHPLELLRQGGQGGSRASPVGARFAGPAGPAPRHHTPPLAARALVARPAAAAHTPGSGAGRARTSCCPLLNRRHLHTCPQIHISMKIHTSVYIKYQNVQMFTFKFDTTTHQQQQLN